MIKSVIKGGDIIVPNIIQTTRDDNQWVKLGVGNAKLLMEGSCCVIAPEGYLFEKGLRGNIVHELPKGEMDEGTCAVVSDLKYVINGGVAEIDISGSGDICLVTTTSVYDPW